ncbi:septation protein IspZ, partial [Acinetobacter baumannii]
AQMTNAPSPPRRDLSPGMRLAIDYGPLLAFFAVNFLMPGLPLVRLMAATIAFILGISIAIGVSIAKTGRVSPMLLLTGVLVIV